VAHDPGVGEQPLDVLVVELRHPLGVEPGEAGPEGLALPQDRQPGEPGLEAFEAQLLVQAPLVHDRPPPLLVVVAVVRGVCALPAAVGHRHDDNRRRTAAAVTGPSLDPTRLGDHLDRLYRPQPGGSGLGDNAVDRVVVEGRTVPT
jgi:hypothetical protein